MRWINEKDSGVRFTQTIRALTISVSFILPSLLSYSDSLDVIH